MFMQRKNISSSSAINGYGIKIPNMRVTLKDSTVIRIEKLLKRRLHSHNVDANINELLTKLKKMKKLMIAHLMTSNGLTTIYAPSSTTMIGSHMTLPCEDSIFVNYNKKRNMGFSTRSTHDSLSCIEVFDTQ